MWTATFTVPRDRPTDAGADPVRRLAATGLRVLVVPADEEGVLDRAARQLPAGVLSVVGQSSGSEWAIDADADRPYSDGSGAQRHELLGTPVTRSSLRSTAGDPMSNQSFEDSELARGSIDFAGQDTVVSVRWVSSGPAGPQLRAHLDGPAGDSVTPTRGSVQLEVSLAVMTGTNGSARAVVVASGEIDIATAGPLHAAALAVATAAHPRADQPVPLVLDWERVVFLDSSGVHVLQDIYAEGVDQGWALTFIPPSAPAPARLLRFAADHGWLPTQLTHQLPSQSRRVIASRGAEA